MANLKTRPKIKPLQIVFSVALVGSLIFGGYYFKQYQDLKSVSSMTQEDKNKQLIARANEVFELPSEETPLVLAVTKDPKEFTTEQEKIFSNAFKQLRKGDVIFLYEKVGKAIHYRDSEHKVIDTTSYVINSGASIHIIASGEVQNSTETTLINKLGKDIRVSSKSTPLGQYTAITVVDISGQKAEIAKKIAETLGGTVATTLPAGEKAADGAEIVVVMGSVPASAAPASTEGAVAQ